MLFSQQSLQSIMMLAGLGVICWLLLRGKFRRRRGGDAELESTLRHNGNATQVPSAFSGCKSLGAPPDVLRWQVELHELARELQGQLDSKILAVRALTRACDQAGQRLGDLLARAERIHCCPDSPAQHVQRLSQLGWSAQKISVCLGLSTQDVTDLLASAPGCHQDATQRA